MQVLQADPELQSLPGSLEFIKTLSKFSWRLLIDLFSLFVLLRWVYFRKYKHSDLFFTFFIFNLIIFLICFLMNRIEISLGAAFGLFAVFSMLRYRTEDLNIKDMTYLFLVIAIGLIAAITKLKDTADVYEYLFIGLINAIILFVTFAFESNLLFRRESVKLITYEKLELIVKGKEQELLQDLSQRTGINIQRVSLGKIDFAKQSAQIKIYYFEEN